MGLQTRRPLAARVCCSPLLPGGGSRCIGPASHIDAWGREAWRSATAVPQAAGVWWAPPPASAGRRQSASQVPASSAGGQEPDTRREEIQRYMAELAARQAAAQAQGQDLTAEEQEMLAAARRFEEDGPANGDSPAKRRAQGGSLEQAVAGLRSRLEAAVRAEEAEQRRQQQAAYKRSSARRLQDDGLALLGLQAAPQGRLFGEFVWRFALPDGTALPYHRFKRGDTVILAQQQQQQGRGRAAGSSSGEESDGGTSNELPAPLEGTVLEVQRQVLLVTLSKAAADELGVAQSGALWRLDQGSSSVTTQRQLAALAQLDKLPDDASVGAKAVRAILLGAPQAERLAARATAWAQQESWRQEAKQQLQAVQQLNRSQRAAIAYALSRTLTLWQGPPGTGKTRTLLAFIQVLVAAVGRSALARERQGAILAVGDTNAAADNLLEGLLARDIAAVRVGSPAKVRPELRGACLDAQVERTAAGQRAARLREHADGVLEQLQAAQSQQARWLQQAQALLAAGRQLTPQQSQQLQQQEHAIRAMRREADVMWRQADTLVKEAAIYVLRSAPVVVATCNGSGEARLEGQCFRIVVLDEASQATEPASLVPLVKGAECVIMAGDQKQLPPTVLSAKALELGLDVPLFTRLLKAGITSRLLDVQYRMHPAIAAFPSQHFYGGRVRTGVSAEDRPPVKGVPWSSQDCPVLFINVPEGREERTASSGGGRGGGRGSDSGNDGGGSGGGGNGGASYCNPVEAEMAVRALVRLVEGDSELQSVALLSPYSGQVRLLSSLVAKAGLPEEALQRCSLAVSTVDGYQGREADAVIFSAVRSNEGGRVGFLADERRLNVAITRPRRGLIVVGNQATLAADPNWRAWMGWLAAQHAVRQAVPASPPPQQRKPSPETDSDA